MISQQTAMDLEFEQFRDKIEGLEADLASAVEVAFKRGAVEWTRLNYPKIYERLSALAPVSEALDGQGPAPWDRINKRTGKPKPTPGEAGGDDSNAWYSSVQIEEIARQNAERDRLLKQLDHCASQPMRNLETFPMICERAARAIRTYATEKD